jgi:O-antigen/teichoic acid export membrane protein
VGSKLAYLPVNEGLGPLRSLFFPAFSRMTGDTDRLRHAYLKGQGMVSLIAMPVGFGFAIVAAPLVELALGKNWSPAVPVIQIFAAMSALQASESVQPLAMALNRTRDLFRRDMQVLLIRIPLVLAGLAAGAATQIGVLMGIVIGSSAASLILLGLSLHLVSVLSGMRIARQLSVTIRPFFAALVMSAGLIIVRNFTEHFASLNGPLVDIAITIGTGAVLYLATLALLWLASGRPEGAEAELLTLSHRSWLIIRARARLGHP